LNQKSDAAIIDDALGKGSWRKAIPLLVPTMILFLFILGYDFTIGSVANVQIVNRANTMIENVVVKTSVDMKTVDIIDKGTTASVHLRRMPFVDVVNVSFKTPTGKVASAVGFKEFDILSQKQVVDGSPKLDMYDGK